MTDAPLTLKSFFSPDPSVSIADCLDTDEAREALAEACGAAPAPLRAGLLKALSGSLDELFGVGVGDVLDNSWGKVASLQETLRATLADPGKIAHVPLLDHKVSSKHQPHIDLMLGGKQLCRLVFDIALTLNLRGVQLDVRKGAIHGLTAGEAQGEGAFTLGGQTLIKRTTPAIALPGRLAFSKAEA